MAEEAKKEEAEPEEKAGASKKKIILLAVGALILVGAAVGGTVMVMGGGDAGDEEVAEEVEEPVKEPIYIALDPTFVVNYKDENAKNRFLKAELNIMTFESEVEEAVTKHMPLIRGNLVSLFNKQVFEELILQEGREAFRADALAALQGIMQTHLGKPGVEQLYFGTFVTQ